MAEVASSLASFEGPNPFEALELHNDESIADVESPEEILQRVLKRAAELALKDSTVRQEAAYVAKVKSFQEGELDDGWTIVASRRTKRSNKNTETVEHTTTEEPPAKSGKPKKWPRSILVLGTAAALGFASFLINRRLRRIQEA